MAVKMSFSRDALFTIQQDTDRDHRAELFIGKGRAGTITLGTEDRTTIKIVFNVPCQTAGAVEMRFNGRVARMAFSVDLKTHSARLFSLAPGPIYNMLLPLFLFLGWLQQIDTVLQTSNNRYN